MLAVDTLIWEVISGSMSEAQESDKEGRKAKMCNTPGSYFKRMLLM